MLIREMQAGELDACCDLVRENWGDEAADRCRRQGLKSNIDDEYAPLYLVAIDRVADGSYDVVGFAAYEPTMLMKGAFNLIWIAIAKDRRSLGLGRVLTETRIELIKARGGVLVQLVTQKPDYFKRHGFYKLTELDNGWWLMMRRLGEVQI